MTVTVVGKEGELQDGYTVFRSLPDNPDETPQALS